ncbi:glycosyltransferase family 4 protein [Geojedonia litorea]|uniref:Glycosyltransferase family 4 protein n=1 Tax=Geojedonia litorea TaxID=1268269 RepID=A0ABV9N346_9FLAO
MKSKISISCIFESYPVFYQPYMPPVMEALEIEKQLEVSIQTFKGKASSKVEVMPGYFRRRVVERWQRLIGYTKIPLQYNELQALKKKVDLVHVQHSYLFPKVLGLLAMPKDQGPKIVITLRGGDTYVKPWVSAKWQDFYRDFGNRVDAFVVMSQHQKQYLHKKWGIDLERIHVIPISFGHAFKASPKAPNSKIIKIVSIFRMCWEKNIEGNLRVIKLLKEQGLPVKYDVYGDGPDLGQLYYLVDQLGLGDIVTIKGKVSNTQLKTLLPSYDFILQLSHSESFGMSVVEAQSMGIPALVSTSDGLPEAIVPNHSGYCVAPNASEQASLYIDQLWRNKNLYLQFSKAAIDYAHSNFSVEHEVKRLLTLYQKLSV